MQIMLFARALSIVKKSAYTYQIFTELGEETCELISSLERYMTYIGDIFKQR